MGIDKRILHKKINHRLIIIITFIIILLNVRGGGDGSRKGEVKGVEKLALYAMQNVT